MSKYTLYIVTRSKDHHYPVLLANNGKVTINEAASRAGKLEQSARRLWAAMVNADAFSTSGPRGEANPYFTIQRIAENDFRKKFPSFAPNKGKKRSTKTK